MPIEVPESTLTRWRTLTNRLQFNTQRGRVVWEDGALHDSIVTRVGEYALSIQRFEGGNAVAYQVKIFDQAGDTLDSFSDEQLDQGEFDFSGEQSYPYFLALDVVFREAKRKITGADEAIDRILGNLLPDPNEF